MHKKNKKIIQIGLSDFITMLLSIITINYNNKKGLQHTIQSVINQNNKDFEYIIIDGGSTDGSLEIIHQYQKYITYWISEKDSGIYNAMNKGLLKAKGEYCNFLNSGDFYPKNAVELLSQNKGKDICIGKALCFYPSTPKKIIWAPPTTITLANIFVKSLNHQAAFIRTSLMQDLRYNEDYKIIADWDFFIRAFILKNCSYRKIDAITVNYELGGLSSKNMNLYKIEKEKMFSSFLYPRIFKDYENILVKPDRFTKYIVYNSKYPLLKNITTIFSFIISIPIRFYKFIKYKFY